MKILRTVKEIQEFALNAKKAGRTIGLVPTMGALHEGHLTLMRTARAKCDVVIASVFVNPTQFGPNEDYEKYPRRFAEDEKKMEIVGIDAVFHPEPSEMYPERYCTYVTVEGDFTHKLCGATRPIHFRGVATVVTKLINLARADEAFFGQKDAQQVCVVRRFVEDLNINCHINMVPIVREPSGLARSSRNEYMSPEERARAAVLYESLKLGKAAYDKGERDAETLKKIVRDRLEAEPFVKQIDYVEILTFPYLDDIKTVKGECLMAIACYVGRTRLIDNVILGQDA